MSTRSVRYGLAFGWAFFILFATIANTATLQQLSLQDLFQFDKLIHAILFGVQAWLLIRARMLTIYKSTTQVIVYCCLLSVAYGLFTEVLQGLLTTSRTFDYYDWLADTVGVLIVMVLYFVKAKPVAQ
jgi:VanZ family protein